MRYNWSQVDSIPPGRLNTESPISNLIVVLDPRIITKEKQIKLAIGNATRKYPY